MIKLHKQFGHASSRNLENLLKRAGIPITKLANIIDKVVSHCKTCQQYKKPIPRPAVGLLKANDFNDTLAMDLHQLEQNLWYLHLIDKFSRFSNAVIIKSKSTNIIIKKILKYRICLFGSPNTIFSDNGGEFVSKEFIDFCENFNIKVKTTAAEAPWSNRICERHNAIITYIILKVKNDTNCDWETALAWAISAKDCFINVSGFSPHQIVLGRNINLPSIYNDKPSANIPQNDIIIEHSSVLHATR